MSTSQTSSFASSLARINLGQQVHGISAAVSRRKVHGISRFCSSCVVVFQSAASFCAWATCAGSLVVRLSNEKYDPLFVFQFEFWVSQKELVDGSRASDEGTIIVELHISARRQPGKPSLNAQANGIIKVSVNMKKRHPINVRFGECLIKPTLMKRKAFGFDVKPPHDGFNSITTSNNVTRPNLRSVAVLFCRIR